MDLSHFKQLYLQTSFEQLQHLHEGLEMLSADKEHTEGIASVYINAHTLVSKSMLMGYTDVGLVAHGVEKIFYKIKTHEIHLSSEILALVKTSTEQLEKALLSIEKNELPIDLSPQKSELEKVIGEPL